MKKKDHGFVGSDFGDAVSSSRPATLPPDRREEPPPRPLGSPSLSTAELGKRTGAIRTRFDSRGQDPRDIFHR